MRKTYFIEGGAYSATSYNQALLAHKLTCELKKESPGYYALLDGEIIVCPDAPEDAANDAYIK